MRQRRKTAGKYQTMAAWQSGPCLAGWRRLPGSAWSPVARGAGEEEEAGLRLTDADGGLAPQQQLQALRAVSQAAVVQGRAALPRLFVQVPAGEDGRTDRERERRIGKSQVRGLGSGSGRGSRRPGSWLAGSLVLLQGGGATAPAQLVAGGGLGLRPVGNKRRWQSQPKKGGEAPVHP